jgi:hypothetical protein
MGGAGDGDFQRTPALPEGQPNRLKAATVSQGERAQFNIGQKGPCAAG